MSRATAISGHKNDALGDAALSIRRAAKGSLRETRHQIAALLVTDEADARQLMKMNEDENPNVVGAEDAKRRHEGR